MKNFIKITFFLTLFIIQYNCSSSNDESIPIIANPNLTTINPTSGPKETLVSINGENFGTNVNAIQVFFNDADAIIQTVTETKITAIVPLKAFTGLVKVIVNGTELVGPEFTYIITDILVNSLAGNDTAGDADATGTSASFKVPKGVAIDKQGNIYVADAFNHRIRKITPSGVVTTLAGSTAGDADGTGTTAQFNRPLGLTVDSQGNVYVADTNNQIIRKITPSGVVTTLAGSTAGFSNGTGSAAQFYTPIGLAIDSQGTIYVADSDNHKIRKITPNGEVNTFVGSSIGYADGTGTAAQFNSPTGITIDNQDNIYVADELNHKIRKITPSGVVTTLAGSTEGYADGTSSTAQFSRPARLTIDPQGNVYVADPFNHRIRKITPNGEVTTFAGSIQGYAEGIGTEAQFNYPGGLTIDSENSIYVADAFNHRVRKITQE
ncbi:IPT/TIG domain-containing protein [Lutibacter sp.]|uniref:NHL domain-containing protein n=1 Tax=Lutibacter sp. TaxID=1925666 RepID=UPI0025C1446A|nr:IPT/TIG domain-containing protein [Lutibacter sp.]MCF6169152.1 IPT/TIG domain-containing protein [Lutibacter sp.]